MTKFDKKQHEEHQLLFFTVATGVYKSFIVPYMYFAFKYNPNAIFEFVLDDINGFLQENREALDYLKSLGCVIIYVLYQN